MKKKSLNIDDIKLTGSKKEFKTRLNTAQGNNTMLKKLTSDNKILKKLDNIKTLYQDIKNSI